MKQLCSSVLGPEQLHLPTGLDQGPLLLRLADMALQAAKALYPPAADGMAEPRQHGSLAEARNALQVMHCS